MATSFGFTEWTPSIVPHSRTEGRDSEKNCSPLVHSETKLLRPNAAPFNQNTLIYANSSNTFLYEQTRIR